MINACNTTGENSKKKPEGGGEIPINRLPLYGWAQEKSFDFLRA